VPFRQAEHVRPDEYAAAAAAARMEEDGNVVSRVDLAEGPSVVGYRAQFRVRWLATKLHTFTVVVPVATATLEVLNLTTQQSIDDAKQEKGPAAGAANWRRGSSRVGDK
jgi:hypothetical protein